MRPGECAVTQWEGEAGTGARMRYRQQQRAGGGGLPAALGGEAGQSLAADACRAIVLQVQAPASPQWPGSMIQASGKRLGALAHL